jgi:hypothetical protein
MLTDVIAREPDMQVVPFQLAADVASTRDEPDVMVCEIENPLDRTLAAHLLSQAPRAHLLMVASTGERAVLYGLQPRHQVFPDVSMEEVIRAIRHGLPDGTAWPDSDDRSERR